MVDFTFWPKFAKEYFATVYIEIMYLPFGLEFAVVSPSIGFFPANNKREGFFLFPFFFSLKKI